MGIFQSISKAVKYVANPLKGSNVKVISNVVPFSKGGVGSGAKVISKAGNIAKTVYSTVKDFTVKKSINPLVGVKGAGNIAKKLGGIVGTGALVGTLFQGARQVSKAGASGELPTSGEVTKSLTKGAVVGAGIAASPFGGIMGALEGGGYAAAKNTRNKVLEIFSAGQSRITDEGAKLYEGYKNIKEDLPTNPSYSPVYNFTFPEMPQYSMPQSPQAIYIESPQTPSISTPSFSPSISLGGGSSLMENLPLLLLLGAGVGGFALGRRRRKKKKYKKSKRRK